MSKRIYNGYNFIYEQMANDQKPPADAGVDPIAIITQLYSYLNSLLIVYEVKGTETTQSFDELTGEFQSAKSIDEIRKAFMGLVNKIAFPDDNSKKASNEYFVNVFDTLMKVPDVNGKFGDIQKKLLELLSSSKASIAKSQQVKAVAESLLEKGHGYLENNGSDTTTDDSDGDDTPSNKWYVELANHVMDMATSFKAETTEPLLDPAVAADPQAKTVLPKAQDLYNKALDLQILGKRKGWIVKGKINAKGGLMKGRDFRIACENLLDEIKRNRDILNKIKSSLTKLPAPPPIVVTNTKAPASTGSGTKNIKTPNNGQGQLTCNFPIAISLHVCDQVKELQTHLMAIPCINDQLSKHGGADGKYGKFTSMIANVVYSVVTKNDKFSSSVLTQEMHTAIMEIPTRKTKTNENINSILSNKVFEKEHEKKTETLRFDDFDKVFDNAKKLMEQEAKTISDFDLICKKVSDKIKTMPAPVVGGGGAGSTKPDATGGTDPNKNENKDWKGLKPATNNIYYIEYDESTAKSWAQAGVGLLVAGVVIGTAGAALGAFAPATIGAAALSTSAGAAAGGTALGAGLGFSGIGAAAAGAAGATSVPVLLGGAALGGSWSRAPKLGINLFNGFISNQGMIQITRGMIDTLDGWVSHNDLEAIMATLCLMKGAFTCNSDQTKAVSAWSELKAMYQAKEKEDMIAEINKITTRTTNAVENFPDFNSSDPGKGSGMNADDALPLIKEAINKLNANDSAIGDNIKGISEEDIKALIQNVAVTKKDGAAKKEEKKEA